MLQAKRKGYKFTERKSSDSDSTPRKPKSYSMMLLQLTREQSQRYENGNFLFGSKNSISTIHNSSRFENEGLLNLQDDINMRYESFNQSQKINMKDFKMLARKEDSEATDFKL